MMRKEEEQKKKVEMVLPWEGTPLRRPEVLQAMDGAEIEESGDQRTLLLYILLLLGVSPGLLLPLPWPKVSSPSLT